MSAQIFQHLDHAGSIEVDDHDQSLGRVVALEAARPLHQGLGRPDKVGLRYAGSHFRSVHQVRHVRNDAAGTQPIRIHSDHGPHSLDLLLSTSWTSLSVGLPGQELNANHVLGPHFEGLAREFVLRFASPETTGGRVCEVGAAVVNDARGRTQHEIDVVVKVGMNTGAQEVAAIGEAKHTTRVRTIADLNRLEGIRTLLVERDSAAATTKLLLFSAAGFDRNLRASAEARDDLELIDLDRMYQGS